MAKIKLTKNELKVQKDALKMYKRYLPTLQLKKQQLQSEIRSIDAKAKEVRAARVALEKEFDNWIAVFGEKAAFKPDMVTVKNIKKGFGNIAGVTIPVYIIEHRHSLSLKSIHTDKTHFFIAQRIVRQFLQKLLL